MKSRWHRSVLAQAGGLILVTASTLTVYAGSNVQAASKPCAGVTLNVITQPPPYIAGPVLRVEKAWDAKTGGKINLITVPYSELYSKIMTSFITGTNSYDVILFGSDWLGDFYPYLRPLNSYVHHDPGLKWQNILYTKNAYWGKTLYAMPLDGDNMAAYYQRSLFANKTFQSEFQKEFHYPLAAPTTWNQYLNIAKFFDGKVVNGHKIYGDLGAYQRGGQAFWFYMAIAASYSTLKGPNGAPEPGLFFNPTNMDPLINDPGHLAALKIYLQLLKYGPPGMINFNSEDVRSTFATGVAAEAYDWADTGIVADLSKGTKVKGNTQTIPLPGTHRVWDYRTNKWVSFTTPSQPTWLAFGGWKGAIPKTSLHPACAYNFLSYLGSPKQSLISVTSPATGFNPYRVHQFTDLKAWYKAGYVKSDLVPYLKVLKHNITDPFQIHDLAIPGEAAYVDALELNTSEAAAGQETPAQALNRTAAAWNQITNKLGRAKQLKLYDEELKTFGMSW